MELDEITRALVEASVKMDLPPADLSIIYSLTSATSWEPGACQGGGQIPDRFCCEHVF